MKLIVGLGNPGMQYTATRHNVGFEVIERFAYEENIPLSQKKHKAIIGTGVIQGKKVMLVQPQTYMNRSGESIGEIMNYYSLPLEDLIVIYDDINLPLGALRLRKKGSPGGHNGIKNIISHLGNQEFARIRIGVGEKPPGWGLADYVLSRFSKEEILLISSTIKDSCLALRDIISYDMNYAMNSYNQKRKEE